MWVETDNVPYFQAFAGSGRADAAAVKLHPHRPGAANTVTAYGAGWIEINATRHAHAVLVVPDAPVVPWPPGRFEDLEAAHFEAIAALGPEVVLLGTGAVQRFAHPRLMVSLSARRVGKLIREHAIDVLPGTPQMYAELGRLPTAKKLELPNARYLAAGSRLDQQVADDFFTGYGVKLWSCYHSTEAATVALDHGGKYPTSVGKVLPGVDVRVTGPDGKAVSGKEGLLWVRSKALATVALGPYDREAAGKGSLPAIGAVDKQGWYRTGDTGKVDKNGRLFLTGREDDVVKVEGKRVALGEVEGCLESFPKVKAAQALVVSDPLAGPMVVARVVTASRCQPEEIIDHCARNLAPYKVPRRIEFCERI